MYCSIGYSFGGTCISRYAKASVTLSEVASQYAQFLSSSGLAPFPVEAEPIETAESETIPDSFIPPKEVQEAAKRGLELRRKFNRGGTEVGVARARDLSNGKGISLDTLKRMNSYFSRHEVDKKGMGWDNESNPSAGRVAWLLWGSDAGWAWAKRELARVERLQAEKVKKTDMHEPEFRSLIHKVVKCGGYDVGLEYRPGEVRFPGKGYAKKLKCGYGHIRGLKGLDKMALDAYVHPSILDNGYSDGKIYAVEQIHPDDGEFDELKIMFGFPSIEAARDAYLGEMPEAYFGTIREIGWKELESYRKPPGEPEPETDLSEKPYYCKRGYSFGTLALSRTKTASAVVDKSRHLAEFVYQRVRA